MNICQARLDAEAGRESTLVSLFSSLAEFLLRTDQMICSLGSKTSIKAFKCVPLVNPRKWIYTPRLTHSRERKSQKVCLFQTGSKH